MTFDRRVKRTFEGEEYRADEHDPNLNDFLFLLHWSTLRDIYDDLTLNDGLIARRGEAGRLAGRQAYAVREVYEFRARAIGNTWVLNLFPDRGKQYELSGDIALLSIPELLDNLSLVTLGKIQGDLDTQDCEWFNGNVTGYKNIVWEAGGRALKHYLAHWQEKIEEGGSPDDIFYEHFAVHYQGNIPKLPDMIPAEAIVGENQDELMLLTGETLSPIWLEALNGPEDEEADNKPG